MTRKALPTTFQENIIARKLDNGLTVTLEPMPHLRSVSAGIWIATGSANERKDQSGISHFLEHLLFKGTKKRTARELTEIIESKGGHLNAFTSREYTCLYAKTLDSEVATAIEILSDIIRESTFHDFEKERNVILEEIASIEDVPEDYVFDLLSEQMWPRHALGRSVSGYAETVSTMSEDDVRTYYQTWYRPRNIYVSIAGNFDAQAVIAQIYDEFGGMTPRPGGRHSSAPEFTGGVQTFERPITQDHLCLGFPGPAVSDPDRYAYDILCSALGGGSTSRLFQRIREDEGLAYAIYSANSNYVNAGMMTVYAAVAPENFQQTSDIIFEELRSLRDLAPNAEELEINREYLKGSLLMSLESTFNRMTRMAKSMMYHDRLVSTEEILRALDAVTLEHLHEAAKALFAPDKCAAVLLGPEDGPKFGALPL